MPRASTLDRRTHILRQLSRDGRVQVEELATTHQTSQVTIRKDLSELEAKGHLIRRHGGAIAANLTQTPPEKVSNQKKAIGAAAAQRIRNHSRVLIDFGSTTSAMIPFLAEKTGLVIMTNSLKTAQAVLALNPPPTLLMTGGTWDIRTESLQGQIAEQVLSSYDFDQLVIGCDGIDPTRGTTTFNELTGLSQHMAAAAREVIVVATSDKIGRRIPTLELSWQSIDQLITDDALDSRVRQDIEQQGVEVILAHSEGEH